MKKEIRNNINIRSIINNMIKNKKNIMSMVKTTLFNNN